MTATKTRLNTEVKCRCGTDTFKVQGKPDGYYLICTNEKCNKERYIVL